MRYFFYYLSILLLLFLASCSDNFISADITNNQTRTAKKEQKSRLFVKVNMNNLRVRATPDLEGAVLQRLKAENIIEYMLDSTNFTTMVEMKGEEHHDHWYKVKTDAGNEGWVYGGCIDFLEKKENDRILALKVDAEKRAKASGNKEGFSSLEIVQKKPEVNDLLLKQYQRFLNAIPVHSPNAIQRAIAYYESIFPKSIDGTADEAFADLIAFHEQVYQHWKAQGSLKKYQYMAEEIRRYGSPNMQQDAFCRKLNDNALTFGVSAKELVVLKPNVDLLMRQIYRLVSESARSYLEQYAVEVEKPVLEDQQIVVNITELAAYTIFWDKFLIQYPYAPMKEGIKERRRKYLGLLLRGTSSTPAFDSKTNKLKAEFKDAYERLSTQFGHSPIIEKMQTYHQRLKNADFIQSSSISAAQEEVLNSLK